MKTPTHKVKRYMVPYNNDEKSYWIESPVPGWLGSGVTDCNGVEIFEGDIINDEEDTDVVTFKDGTFWVFDQILEHFQGSAIVVGHIAKGDTI